MDYADAVAVLNGGKTEWQKAVEEGAARQLSKRLHLHTLIARAHKKAEREKEFNEAFAQRESILRLSFKTLTIYPLQRLSLEEMGRLFVINLGTWEAFKFWRDVRGKPNPDYHPQKV